VGDFGEAQGKNDLDQLSDQEAMQQLIDLGYIERPDGKIENAIIKTTCDLKHNLARVYKGKKDFVEAKKIFLELVEDNYPKITQEEIDKVKKEQPKSKQYEGFQASDPIVDVSQYFIELLDISIKEKEYDQAENYLQLFNKVNKRLPIDKTVYEVDVLIGKRQSKLGLEKLYLAIDRKPKANYWFKAGTIHLQLEEFKKAKTAFINALSFEVDSAKYHQALAVSLIRLQEYEDAAEHAFTAIELVKYFPEAHYTLGEALEKLGDLDNAKIAYETAARLKPTTHYRAETSIKNIKDKLDDNSSFQ
jgi:tetratricopeptide (TPR) repeat protein